MLRSLSPCVCFFVMLLIALPVVGSESQPDIIETDGGELIIHFIGHGTLMLEHGDLVIHVDPWTRLADYEALPDADLVLVTHAHADHADAEAIKSIRKPETLVIGNAAAAEKIESAEVMTNGDVRTFKGVKIEAVPAYNILHRRSSGEPYHPKGRDNGYVLTLSGTRVYVAGDTENVPEMDELAGVDVAFLPMNLPYTMTPEMVAEAARRIRPKVLYPYHFGGTDTAELVRLLASESAIDVRVRAMQ